MFKRGFVCYKRSREVVLPVFKANGGFTYEKTVVPLTISMESNKRFNEVTDEALDVQSAGFVCSVCGEFVKFNENDYYHEWRLSAKYSKRVTLF